MPAALASSIAYWINGLSTTVSISFGIALVAGRMRVPRPATGNTALRTCLCMYLLGCGCHAGDAANAIDLYRPARQPLLAAPALNVRNPQFIQCKAVLSSRHRSIAGGRCGPALTVQ